MRTLGKCQRTLATVSSSIVKRNLGTASSEYNTAVDNCTALVKQHDFDNYLAGLLLPKKHRAPYFAVRAFHVELALIKDQSRGNALSGRMRFQFWRDSIDQVFAQKGSISTQTPVARALHHHVDQFSQSHRFFIRALDARCPKVNFCVCHQMLSE
jgi:phytoene/squalene synthetase